MHSMIQRCSRSASLCFPYAFTMSASTSGRPFLSEQAAPYDVFISHCGRDCKRDFAVFLKNELERSGVRAFLDDRDLRPGDLAADVMLGAMGTAKYGVVLLTRGFFEREWCVKELQTFLGRGNIIPVFFTMAFDGLPSAWKKFEFFQWTEGEYQRVVQGATSYVGFRLEAHDGYWDTCIAALKVELLHRLNILDGGPRLTDPDQPVFGFEGHVEEVKRMMGIRSTDGGGRQAQEVSIVAVKGMGGVGKSTLARKIHDDEEVRSFFSGGLCWLDVNQNPSAEKICGLQKHILSRLAGNEKKIKNPEEGRAVIRQSLQFRKVLICLDDVWADGQLPVVRKADLGPGSCILKTTRDAKTIELDGRRYDLDVLSSQSAEALLRFHAFRFYNPSKEDAPLIQKSLQICGNLPLALQVLGSAIGGMLARSGRSQWQEFLSVTVGDTPRGFDVRRVLRSSYDTLPSGIYKEAFLLIAVMWPEDTGMRMVTRVIYGLGALLDREEAMAKLVFQELEDRSLIKTIPMGFWGSRQVIVHDLLVDVASSIIQEQHPIKFGNSWSRQSGSKSTRRWEHLLVEGQSLPATLPCSLKSLVFSGCQSEQGFTSRMEPGSDCKLVVLRGYQSHQQLPMPLIIYWELFLPTCLVCLLGRLCQGYRNLPTWLIDLKGLRTLILAGCSFSFPTRLGRWSALRTLDLRGSCWWPDEESLPESLRRLTALRTLILAECSNLKSLPTFIGHLASLQTLNMQGCTALEHLPETLGRLKGLTALDLEGCKLVTLLPQSLGHLRQLCMVNLRGCHSLSIWPESAEWLMGLQNIDLLCFPRLSALPECLGQGLTWLTALDLQGCTKLSSLPDSLGHLTGLKALMLRGCVSLKALPVSVALLTGLETLDLGECSSLEELPESVGQLSHLTDLHMRSCSKITSLPKSLGHLSALKVLDLRGCCALTALPDSLEHLVGLRVLNLESCIELTRLPESLWRLTGLKTLGLQGWRLTELPEAVGQLQGLETLSLIKCWSLTALPESLSKLTRLTILDLRGCSGLGGVPEWLRQLEGLKIIGG